MANKRIVLMIEDNPLLSGLYSAALRKKGFEVFVAHNGEDGLKLTEEKHPDILVLDLFMPGMDGFQVMQKLRDNPNTKNTRVIVLTVSGNDEHRKKAISLGAEDYLLKQDLHLNQIIDRISLCFPETCQGINNPTKE